METVLFLFKKNTSESSVHVKSYSYLTICIHSGLLLEFILCLLSSSRTVQITTKYANTCTTLHLFFFPELFEVPRNVITEYRFLNHYVTF